MIVDTFMFDDEFEMLDCRLYELNGIVDRFIAIEANHSFTGIPKPYNLTAAKERYADYPLEIVTVDTTDVSSLTDQRLAPYAMWAYAQTVEFWRREVYQRLAVDPILRDLPPDAVILHGDLDEIPRREIVAAFDGPVSVCRMTSYVYSIGLCLEDAWAGTVMGKRRDMGQMAAVRASRWWFEQILRGGWHLSWFGSPERRVHKFTHSAHQEWRETVGDSIGAEYPAKKKHLGGLDLIEWYGGAPHYVLDGRAPEIWTKRWWE